MSDIVIYETEDRRIAVNVRLDDETVWLTQRQMAELFDTSTDNTSLNLKNIHLSAELDETTTTEESSADRGFQEARQTQELLTRTSQNQSSVYDSANHEFSRGVVQDTPSFKLLSGGWNHVHQH